MRESGEKKYGIKVEKKIRRKKRKSVLAVPGLCFRSKYVEPIGKATDLWKRIQNLHRLFKPLRCASVHSSHTDKKAKENYNLIFLSTGTVALSIPDTGMDNDLVSLLQQKRLHLSLGDEQHSPRNRITSRGIRTGCTMQQAENCCSPRPICPR